MLFRRRAKWYNNAKGISGCAALHSDITEGRKSDTEKPVPAFGGYERKYMSEQKKTSIGGQALLEGIMMRGPKVTAIAVRDPEGRMVLEKYPTKGNDRPKFCRLPFIRGIFNLYDSLVFGYKCLMRSAEIAGLEEEEAPKKGKAPVQEADKQAAQAGADAESQAPETGEIGAEETSQAGSAGAQPAAAESAEAADGKAACSQEPAAAREAAAKGGAKEKSGKEKAQSAAMMIFSVVLGLLLAIGLFIYLPSLITKWLSGAVPAFENQVLRSVAEGVIRIIIFIGYMASMLLMKDIRRTYMYHGAEHKTIFCYENGLPLTVENVRRQSRFHPRCGTSFMILMLFVGIFISMFISTPNPVVRTLIKLACLPVVVSIGYELIKLAGRYDNIFTRIISAPGKWLQRITTREPDDSMIECAIAAFEAVVPKDGSDNW